LGNFFVNRWLFGDSGYDVTIGLYEDIFGGNPDDVVFTYFSENKASLDTFRDELVKYHDEKRKIPEVTVIEDSSECELRFPIPKKELIQDSKAVLKPWLTEYAVVMKKAFRDDVREF
jgi:hypothetical protein